MTGLSMNLRPDPTAADEHGLALERRRRGRMRLFLFHIRATRLGLSCNEFGFDDPDADDDRVDAF